jgi:hypothetical protein
MKIAIAPMLLALVLAACGKAEDKTAEGASAPSLGASIAPVDMDGPSTGKWKLTTSMAGQAMPSVEVCYDKKMTFAEAEQAQKQAGMECSEQSYRRDGPAVVGRSVCTMNGTKMVTDTRIVGDFNSAYTMDIMSTMDPAPMPGMDKTQMQIKAERLGDC